MTDQEQKPLVRPEPPLKLVEGNGYVRVFDARSTLVAMVPSGFMDTFPGGQRLLREALEDLVTDWTVTREGTIKSRVDGREYKITNVGEGSQDDALAWFLEMCEQHGGPPVTLNVNELTDMLFQASPEVPEGEAYPGDTDAIDRRPPEVRRPLGHYQVMGSEALDEHPHQERGWQPS